MSCSTALGPILFSLYPLIRRSLIKHHLEMAIVEYREDDVRSSELKTGLSANAESLCKVVDTTASKLPLSSSSPPLHALSEVYSLKETHLSGFRKNFSFPKVPPLDCLVQVKKLVVLPTKRCAFMRLTFYAAFVSLSTHSSCNYCVIFKLPLVNSSPMLGGQL